MSDNQITKQEHSPNNSTHPWVIVLGTLLVQISAGSFYAWAIFNNGFMMKTGGKITTLNGVNKIIGGYPAASVSFTFTLGMICLALGTLIGIPLCKRYGIKLIDSIASIIFGGSIFALMTIHKGSHIWLLWMFGGVILGAMNGILYLTTLTNAIQWFPNKKGLISGISVAGYGLGSFIFKYIDKWVAGGNGAITGANINRVILWWGIIALILAFGGSLMLKDAPVSEHFKTKVKNDDQEDFSPQEMLHTPQAYMMIFCLTTASMFMALVGSAVTNLASVWTQTPENVSIWSGSSAAAMFVAVVAIANTVGRFVMGWISDKIPRKFVFYITFIVQLIAVLALIIVKPGHMPMWLMDIDVMAMAFCFGGNITVFPTFVSDYFGLRDTSANYSIIYQSFGIGALIVGLLTASGNPLHPGIVHLDQGVVLTQNFPLVNWTLVVMIIVSLIFFVIMRKPTKN